MTTTVRCPQCWGRGTIEVEDSETPCEAAIVIGSEVIGCFGSRKHPGQPHMAILCEPCICCGQFDECDITCGVYPMEPLPKIDTDWWMWNDGDLTVTRAGLLGQVWRDDYQPDSPHARKRVPA